MDERTRTRTGGQSEKASKTRNIRTMPVRTSKGLRGTRNTLWTKEFADKELRDMKVWSEKGSMIQAEAESC